MPKEMLPTIDIVNAWVPIDISNANGGGVADLRCKMDDCERLIVLLHKGIGTAGQDPTVVLTQYTAASAGSSKALNCIDKYYYKQGSPALTSTQAWTVGTQTADEQITDATWAENELILAFEVKAEDLDRANGYYWIGVTVADVGDNAQLCGCLYLKVNPRYAHD